MEKPTANNEMYVCMILSSCCVAALFWFHQPEALILLPGFSLVFLLGALAYNHMYKKAIRGFLMDLIHRNPLDVSYAIELLETHHIANPDAFRKQEPYWTLISNKIYEDLKGMEFIRDFCPVIAKNERLNGAYIGRFVEQGHGNAIRELWKRQKMVISKPNDDGTIKYFLDALEACLACVDTGVVGETMAPEEYKTVDDLLARLDKPTLKQAVNEWPKIRTQETKAPWEHHWDGLWSHFREKYTEAVPAPVA